MPHVQPAELVRGRQSAAVTRDERIARNVLYRGVGGIKTPVLTARTVPQLGRQKRPEGVGKESMIFPLKEKEKLNRKKSEQQQSMNAELMQTGEWS